MTLIGDFVKRENYDKTIDLICTHCFRTAGKGTSDAEALMIAGDHKCIWPFFASPEESEERSMNSQRGTF
jgi:hypothetical protein